MKALLSYNEDDIDYKIEKVIAKRKKEKGFDKLGECDRLLEHKPRDYILVDEEL